ncbi:tRNA U34 5-methylaminomethyl-2-thiouridine-forming methyltransferase MnmC [Filimonas lacunae]|uniref:tRNA U34 5-methylaminomethyl-2-thiouridine-forming methyltransferase MnmC n=1 Tax=Filimonas lacunae TaxID=477680 RepID=A0A173MNY4_9BACT|nr:tRNA (5-methylaminomethyl-2-thiouridine)(34)-methyltransferase MnmD [Filimonas lacunae]BAV09352.1 peptidase [Filimonas lacunae]SIS71573.1 tRNA U34 5-methylaminomethyl-2-thiouridine-forming methyltransferase MnmC [Filimonas lacunae]
MGKELLLTADGSYTIEIPELKVTYHSRHGAIQESMHVFIRAGLMAVPPVSTIRILEMGFGTGLNALLALQYAIQQQQPIYYQTLELHPLTEAEAAHLNYVQQLSATEADYAPLFTSLHSCAWDTDVVIHPLFTLHKTKVSLHELPATVQNFHVLFYDAFAPAAQPELWTADTFKKVYHTLQPGGKMVTYCSKSIVRRAMQEAGFTIEKIQGPWGKREMLRATRPL